MRTYSLPNKLKSLCKALYFQVIVAIVLGGFLGWIAPDLGVSLKPLGDGFVRLIKMIIAPVIFLTVALGIAKAGDLKTVGRVGFKAMVYFEIVSTIALLLGLMVANVLRPGAGVHADPATLNKAAVAGYTTGAKSLSTVEFLLNIIPETVVGAFANGEILQVLLLAILFGVALSRLGTRVEPLVSLLDQCSQLVFGVIALIMRVAPLGAMGAMAFTIGAYGLSSLFSLGKLLAGVSLTCLLFVTVVLGGIARLTGFSLFRLLRYIKEELLIVLGTSSSESVLPRLMAKLENAGLDRSVVGLVVPAGYSFNLDGTSIYLTMAVLFIAQAFDIGLAPGEQLALVAILAVTSKGAATVTGGGFVTLAATLAMSDKLPVAGLALLLGVDRFMSEARALTNLVGNAVATIAIARWEGALDVRRLTVVLRESSSSTPSLALPGIEEV